MELLLGSVFFMAFGGIIMIGGIIEIRLAQLSKTWPKTVGTVIVSKIETSSDMDYRPFVKFSYQVNGQSWTGDKVFFGDGKLYTSIYKYSSQVVNNYPVTTRVNVFYHPLKPSIAVIEPGVTKKTFSQFGFGSIFFVIGFSPYFVMFMVFLFDLFS